MIYTITLNPSIDYVVEAENVRLGELNHMQSDYKFPGGKGINVSRVLQELGFDTTALGFLGGFTGDFIKDWLEKDAVKNDFIPIQADTRINIKLKSDTETEINGRGPAISQEESDKLLTRLEGVTSEDTVVLSGSMPPSLPAFYYREMIDIIRKKDAAFIIDTTGRALTDALTFKPLLVKPNAEELAQLFNVTINSQEEVLLYGEKLRKSGARHVIVSMAAEGAYLFTKDGIYRGINPAGKVKNSVGAGDSMVAGFIGEFSQSQNPVRAFQMGMAAGSATAFASDLAKKEDILTLHEEINITRL